MAQELTHMAVWLRIPLVHPEAMDPERNVNRDVDSVDTDITTIPKNENSEETPVEGAGEGEAAVESHGKESPGGVGVGGGAGGGEDEAEGTVVEDPWETWNSIRVLCEHKSW